MDSYQCRAPECQRTFSSIRGRSLHEQKTHKNFYDTQQTTVVHKRAQWSQEEKLLLAKLEARLTIQGVRHLNFGLVPLFPSRTLEAIKGQRRQPTHKIAVRKYLDEMEAGPLPSPQTPTENTSAACPNADLQTTESLGDPGTTLENLYIHVGEQYLELKLLREFFLQLEPFTGDHFNIIHLNTICEMARSLNPQPIFEAWETYLLQTFPPNRKKLRQPKNTRNELLTLSNKRRRRIEYAITQKEWNKNPSRCIKIILENKHKNTGITPSEDIMVPYWKKIMESGGTSTPGIGQLATTPTHSDLLKPFTLTEMKLALPSISTSPGPDGFTARQLRAVPRKILQTICNLALLCGKLPTHLLEAKTTLIPKKENATNPGDYRPITVPSVLTRTIHKALANRLLSCLQIDTRQRAFLPIDGTSNNILDLDLLLRYHRAKFKSIYLASIDIAKAFDTVTHNTIHDTLLHYGIPEHLVKYLTNVYQRSHTRLSNNNWTSDPIKPNCGVKQGDPLSPIIFNLIIDRLIRSLPTEIGIQMGQSKYNVIAFADDLIFTASTPMGLQTIIDLATNYLSSCGLQINAGKSFTVALRNLPRVKKTIIDGSITFKCRDHVLPSLRREDEWTYLGVPFTPEGRSKGNEINKLTMMLEKITKAPLKPQQRLFGLRTVILPSLFHLLTLGNTTLSRLKKLDSLSRQYTKQWLNLPHDTVNAYLHAHVKDGGLSIPSLRWLMPLHRRLRLEKMIDPNNHDKISYLSNEIDLTKRRLTDAGMDLNSTTKIRARWAKLLHQSIDGRALKEASKVPQQNAWITEPTRLVSGRDFLHMIKLRINALPTKSRTSRGRIADRTCRAGCREIETLGHILQRCHRTHDQRLRRHNALISYVKRNLENKAYNVELEPQFNLAGQIRKPDLIAQKGSNLIILDAQVVSEHDTLDLSHARKVAYYQSLVDVAKERYTATNVKLSSITLSWRGIWSRKAAEDLVSLRIVRRDELKIMSIRTLIGGLSGFSIFNRRTYGCHPRMGIG